MWFGLVMGVVFVGHMASKTIRELRSANQIDSR